MNGSRTCNGVLIFAPSIMKLHQLNEKLLNFSFFVYTKTQTQAAP
jgi:hypothetical protein